MINRIDELVEESKIVIPGDPALSGAYVDAIYCEMLIYIGQNYTKMSDSQIGHILSNWMRAVIERRF